MTNETEQQPPLKLHEPIKTAHAIGLFALASAIAAGFSAWAAVTNSKTAQQQLKISALQYQPQLAMNIVDVGGFDVRQPHARVVIKNVGSVTVFEAEVVATVAVLEEGSEDQIFNQFPKSDLGVSLAPTEVESLSVGFPTPLTAEEMVRLSKKEGLVIFAGRIRFTDQLGRPHARYVCGKVKPFTSEVIKHTYCRSPKQH